MIGSDGFEVSAAVSMSFIGESYRSMVHLECEGEPRHLALGDLVLFAAITIRQIVNTNVKAGGKKIANEIRSVQTPVAFEEFLSLRGTIAETSELSNRRFEALLRASTTTYDFQFKARGFGFMSRKAPEYAPASVMELLAFLAQRHRDDDEFLRSLRFAAMRCADLVTSTRYGQANLSVLTQHRFPMPIALEAMGYDTSSFS